MATVFNRTSQIISFTVAGDDITEERMPVKGILLRATAAGAMVIVIDGTTLNFTTTTTTYSLYIPINRSVNYLKLTSGPAGLSMYAFLEKAM